MNTVVIGVGCFLAGLFLGVIMMCFMAGVGYNSKLDELQKEQEVKNNAE